MDTPLEVSDMPPLTELEHAQLRAMERELRACLSTCTHSYDVTDPDTAFEYLRTYAVKFFDFYHSYYSNVANETYQPHLRTASEKAALQRVLICLKNFAAFDNFLITSSRTTRLKKTISENADLYEPIPKAFTAPVAPIDYAAIGVDLASASPLMKKAVDVFAVPPTPPLPPGVVAQMTTSKPAKNQAVPAGLPSALRQLLEEAQWKPDDIAEKSGIDWRTVYRHLSGEVRPTDRTRWAYEKALKDRLGRSVKLPK